jgi:hypothetical protein
MPAVLARRLACHAVVARRQVTSQSLARRNFSEGGLCGEAGLLESAKFEQLVDRQQLTDKWRRFKQQFLA